MGWLVFLGLGAGALSTVAGLGGGQLLVLALAAVVGPHLALSISSPALLVGNLHRFALYRAHEARAVGRRFALGALPGSILGGLATVGLPVWLIQALLAASTGLAIVRQLGGFAWKPRRASLVPAGLVIGAVSATSSGGGLLVAPILLASGLSGAAYVATSSLCAIAMHLGRVLGYGLGGLVTGDTLLRSAVLAVAILAGNLVGDRLRGGLGPRASTWIEHGTLAACAVLAIAGAGRR
jgi:uncharacterized membrane protein YfcA